jgi:hypothetical protein
MVATGESAFFSFFFLLCFLSFYTALLLCFHYSVLPIVDIRDLSNKKMILNEEAIAVNQDALVKAGDLRLNGTDGGQVWSKVLSNSTWAVILYNSNLVFGDLYVTVQFSTQHLPGWPSAASAAVVRDVNAHKDLGRFTNSFRSTVLLVPHQVQFITVKPVF